MDERRPMNLWLALVVAFAAAGCAAQSSTSGSPPRKASPGDRAPGTPAVSRGVASGTMGDGRVIRLRAFRDDAGACLLILGIDAHTRGCGRVPQERDPSSGPSMVADAIVRREGADHDEIFIATSARVARVRLRVRGAPLAPDQSLLLRADDVGALDRAGITSGPFGYFVAEVPRAAGRIRALAFDARGNRIGAVELHHLSKMGELFVLG